MSLVAAHCTHFISEGAECFTVENFMMSLVAVHCAHFISEGAELQLTFVTLGMSTPPHLNDTVLKTAYSSLQSPMHTPAPLLMKFHRCLASQSVCLSSVPLSPSSLSKWLEGLGFSNQAKSFRPVFLHLEMWVKMAIAIE
ncbi:uncharacterized protein LACBIDRAFT_328043 [Laccaria bicolor S238N-H82]|uniref:Predicted protein n=1 Tax=Laccaria bicolor (strain S238N-H82 / ATCC MYA-4686) TaxID=486041 RepID=B0DDK1_LACBS|nr:uncharacterized protein LACBIDRAFT_328043 [Laccaria bicolor S238N-H82]EDR07101.1 predicted protein [Laccaria bicolor S238N-H82]|eukprot:XP_001882032.1 predicted protein [Laccaria bicolor S238N-H82]